MSQELNLIQEQIKNSSGKEQLKLFVSYCEKIIQMKEQGVFSEEEAGYNIYGVILNHFFHSPECEEVFDVVSSLEIPRESSYLQSHEIWNQETADAIKKQGWKDLLEAVNKLSRSLE